MEFRRMLSRLREGLLIRGWVLHNLEQKDGGTKKIYTLLGVM